MNKELTIDNLYTKYLNEFNHNEEKIISNISKYNDDEERQQLECIKLKQLRTKKKNYFLNNSNDLFNYFECKQQIEKIEILKK
jgi:predicted P-loop ATPase/GTPase